MMPDRIAAAVAALATTLLLSGCGGGTDGAEGSGHDGQAHATTETAVLSGAPAGFDTDDVTFVTDMIPHHQQAVELAALVPDRSTDPELLALATQISAAQQPEIDTMKALQVQWTENPQDQAGMPGMDHGGPATMPGMVDDATMARLKTLTGTEFDTLWLQSMIAHHQGAIEMAEAELAGGRNVDAKTLAQNIVTAQKAEIAQMQAMLAARP